MSPTEPAARPGFLRRRLTDGIRGVAETLFPPNDLGAPDWRATDLVPRTLAWIDELPPPSARLLTAMFVAIELLGGLLTPGLGRFSRLPEARRLRAIRRWRASSLYPLRFVGDSLKATLTMVWLAHPLALQHVGAFKTCDHPADPVRFPIRPHALEEMTP